MVLASSRARRPGAFGAEARVKGPGASSSRISDALLVTPPFPWLRPSISRICSGPRGRDTPLQSRSACRLSLHVTELFRHLAVADLEQVDSPHVAAAPIEAPTHGGAIAGDDHLFGFEPRLRSVLKEGLPELTHSDLANVPLAVGRRQRVLEHAVVRHQSHHRVDVVPAERLVEGFDDFLRAQPWPTMRVMTSPRFGPPLPNGTECTRCANTISATS